MFLDLSALQIAAVVYVIIGIPVLVLLCRGIDTEASELPKDLK